MFRGVIDFGYGSSDFANAVRNVMGGRRFMPENIKRLIRERDYVNFPEKYRDITACSPQAWG